MPNLQRWVHNRYFRLGSFPFFLFILMLLAFGLFIPWLGLYWDDWPIVVSARLRGTGYFWEFFRSERPFSAWPYILVMPVLGTRPIVWHITALCLRWITVLLMWWALRRLWPGQARPVTGMAILFAIYPAFEQQPVAITFIQHWMAYILYFLSLGLMVHAIRSSRRAYLWITLAMACQAIQLWTMEYFAGLELIRPVMLWFLAGESADNLVKKAKFVVRHWLPYLFVMAVFAFWRLFVMNAGGFDRNEPVLLIQVASSPLVVAVRLIQLAVQDGTNIFVAAWSKTLRPEIFDLTDRLVLFSVGVGSLAGILTFLYLYNLRSDSDVRIVPIHHRTWVRQALVLGFLLFLLGPLPVWLTDRSTIWRAYSSRYTLASLFGAGVLWVALLEWITVRRFPKVVLIGVLVSLAIGFHIRWTNDFRWLWKDQLDFFWQLYWRAPSLDPGTAVGADGELFPYVGRNSTALALNLLYPPSGGATPGVWFYEIGPSFSRDRDLMLQGRALRFSHRNFVFTGNTLDTLVISYESEIGNCLWVLSPEDEDNPYLTPMLAGALPISNLDLIRRQPQSQPPEVIFGREPAHDWCYYFQKAGLAAQFEDWQEVARLGAEVQRLGYGPNNPLEWMPFIPGFARSGKWESAIDTTLHVRQVNQTLAPNLCQAWDQILDSTRPPERNLEDLRRMFSRLKCEQAALRTFQ